MFSLTPADDVANDAVWSADESYTTRGARAAMTSTIASMDG
jgi:hypothetical protein